MSRKFTGFGATLAVVAAPLMQAAEPQPPAAAGPAPVTAEAETERQLESARQRLEQAAREVAELSGRLYANVGNRFVTNGRFGPPPRAMLGVQLVRARDGATGAEVEAVSPGGPAEGAGIRKGDRITAVDGRDLTRSEDAGRALIEAMANVEPERKVKLTVVRDGQSREVEVTARPAPRMTAFRGPDVQLRRLGAGPMPDFPPMPLAGVGGGALAGMELATLSEHLGSYFGAKQGVLVVRAGANDAWQLEDGDVIVAIDGREPTSAAHATRSLRSYQRGEKLQLKVLRERRSRTLEVTLPAA